MGKKKKVTLMEKKVLQLLKMDAPKSFLITLDMKVIIHTKQWLGKNVGLKDSDFILLFRIMQT